ncbi:pentapeptide repeat-containing protein [Kamptonema cortianum]|uniref:Pentapeptide repeat-containing protein n=1 Tax=Geitlerinema calcuttense NRMC-F 0142 TaxID=2922238 RepID=A0ABT7M1H3_9CYAN|nr:pentapeptide repeat-containing protein [Geitlerinema calcuttense]MDK3160196.1 pentapeptide repeat-containing protein [Kamptonema cortianum]MDL5057495.1 pentapeptide repeat-containing protein [Geitlerinema calcuttense NRMC-F 0142]
MDIKTINDLKSSCIAGSDPCTSFDNKNLREADLSQANLKGIHLRGVNLSKANLSGADLSGANLIDANLSEANLMGANLSEANLEYVHLRGANLTQANLSQANLVDANLKDANLMGANLWGVKLRDTNLRGANLQGATLPRGEVYEVYLKTVIPYLCTYRGKTLAEVAAAWDCHEWSNCPMHVALGIHHPKQAPVEVRQQVEEFVALFDAGALPKPR